MLMFMCKLSNQANAAIEIILQIFKSSKCTNLSVKLGIVVNSKVVTKQNVWCKFES